jgi:hypothetical protein
MTIQIQIFLGYPQNKEIKMYLNQSQSWKKSKLLGNATLSVTHWQDQEYIGSFISPLSSYNHIKEKEQEIKTQLQLYCPKLNLDKYSACLFPQLFLS